MMLNEPDFAIIAKLVFCAIFDLVNNTIHLLFMADHRTLLLASGLPTFVLPLPQPPWY
jgi:hypothetical protein